MGISAFWIRAAGLFRLRRGDFEGIRPVCLLWSAFRGHEMACSGLYGLITAWTELGSLSLFLFLFSPGTVHKSPRAPQGLVYFRFLLQRVPFVPSRDGRAESVISVVGGGGGQIDRLT